MRFSCLKPYALRQSFFSRVARASMHILALSSLLFPRFSVSLILRFLSFRVSALLAPPAPHHGFFSL
jgi:hypothetical protein